jgi:TolA-binding protein
MISLVEARRDGRLGPREEGSIERHLGACAECRLYATDLEKLACLSRAEAEPLTPLERHRGRARLLQRAALPLVARPRRGALPWKLALPAVAVLASAVAAAAGGVFHPSFFRTGSAATATALPDSSRVASPRLAAPASADAPADDASAQPVEQPMPPAPVERPSAPRGLPVASAAARHPAPSGSAGAHPDDGARLLAEGIERIEKGDYTAAAERLRAFQRARPADARAEDAAFLEILALQRAGRNDEAIAVARAYLVAHPDGYRRAEAEAIARGH